MRAIPWLLAMLGIVLAGPPGAIVLVLLWYIIAKPALSKKP